MFVPLTIGISFAACAMCTADGGCDIVERDGFVSCSTTTGCSGNCRNRYVCPEPPCGAVEDVAVGDGQKSGASCGINEGMALKSTLSTARIFQLAGNDDLVALAVLKLENNAREGSLSDVGAFAFALPKNGVERSRVLAGESLDFAPFGVSETGFADYALDTKDGMLEVTLQVWRVSVTTGQPVSGLTTLLQYRVNDGAMTLLSQQVSSREQPAARAGYFKSKRSNGSSTTVVDPKSVSQLSLR